MSFISNFSRIGRWGATCPVGWCMAIDMCWSKWPPRMTCHDEVGRAMVRGESVVWYTSCSCRVQRINNTQTLWNFPPFFCNDKMIPIDNKRMWNKRLNRRGFTCAYWGAGVKGKHSYLGGKVSIFITPVHTNLLDNLSSFKVRYLCTLPEIVFGTVP